MNDDFPAASALHPERAQYPYSDSFSVPLRRRDVESWELVAAFFQSTPDWVDRLFALRNRIVALFGLKTGRDDARDLTPPYRVERRIGLFRIVGLSGSEAILGEDDRHLDFRTSLLLIDDGSGPRLIVSTLVKTKNALGFAYFSVVKHFHRLIVPIVVKTMAAKIDGRSLPQHRNG